MKTSMAMVLALGAIPWSAPASAEPISALAVVALVKASPQLKIDRSVPAMGAFDPKTHPYVRVAGVPEGTAIGGYLDPEYAHEGTLTDATVVLAIPLDSGGSGGIFTQILFAGKSSGQLAYAGYIDSGGHLDVQISGGTTVARFPHYGTNDPNCCPSKYMIDTYDIVGGKLHKVSTKTVPASPRP